MTPPHRLAQYRVPHQRHPSRRMLPSRARARQDWSRVQAVRQEDPAQRQSSRYERAEVWMERLAMRESVVVSCSHPGSWPRGERLAFASASSSLSLMIDTRTLLRSPMRQSHLSGGSQKAVTIGTVAYCRPMSFTSHSSRSLGFIGEHALSLQLLQKPVSDALTGERAAEISLRVLASENDYVVSEGAGAKTLFPPVAVAGQAFGGGDASSGGGPRSPPPLITARLRSKMAGERCEMGWDSQVKCTHYTTKRPFQADRQPGSHERATIKKKTCGSVHVLPSSGRWSGRRVLAGFGTVGGDRRIGIRFLPATKPQPASPSLY